MFPHRSWSCYTFFMSEQADWITALKIRGLAGFARAALDALEPLGIIGAQMLIIAQPAVNVMAPMGWRSALHDITQALEDPQALAALRDALDEPDEDRS